MAALLLTACGTIGYSAGDSGSEVQELHDFIIRPSRNNSSSQTARSPQSIPTLTEPLEPPHDRLSVGVNYTGGQVRWTFSRKWACEARAQFGQAESRYGDVKAEVIGFRGYRFFTRSHHFMFYTGPEIAMAKADAQNSSYKTSGIAMGAFGGLHFPFASRFSLDTDLGPYVISLKEKQTGISSTNIDFVINSALVVRIF